MNISEYADGRIVLYPYHIVSIFSRIHVLVDVLGPYRIGRYSNIFKIYFGVSYLWTALAGHTKCDGAFLLSSFNLVFGSSSFVLEEVSKLLENAKGSGRGSSAGNEGNWGRGRSGGLNYEHLLWRKKGRIQQSEKRFGLHWDSDNESSAVPS